MFERAFDAIGSDASRPTHEERLRWGNWLLEMYAAHQGEPVGYRADRLLEEWESGRPSVTVDGLRRWSRQIIMTNLCSTQGELAEAAGMPAATLSYFKNGKNLPDRFHAGLRAACERYRPFNQWKAAA